MADAKKFVCCLDCANGTFMQWFDNPIVCECSIRTAIRFVAKSSKICSDFRPSNNPNPEIRHFSSYEESQAMFRERTETKLRKYLQEELDKANENKNS
ncbi:MAG: hypothetical protein IKX93_00140 [Bacteroidaceae bacterium]|nr:hypothetical protein [Bacteroidaceae bacterium]MBR5763018.1 hypothetical protein [Bacteroidaceae bacterium]